MATDKKLNEVSESETFTHLLGVSGSNTVKVKKENVGRGMYLHTGYYAHAQAEGNTMEAIAEWTFEQIKGLNGMFCFDLLVQWNSIHRVTGYLYGTVDDRYGRLTIESYYNAKQFVFLIENGALSAQQ